MLDSVLARWKLTRLIRDWLEYRTVWERYRGAEDVSVETEVRFLRLKAAIASRLPLLTMKVPRTIAQEAQSHHQGITDFLGAYLELRAPEPLSEEERERFVRRWQKHFLFLSELKGIPLGGDKRVRPRVAAAAHHAAPSGIPIFKSRGPRHRPWTVGRFIRALLGTAMLLFAAYLIVVVVGTRRNWSWVGLSEYGVRSRDVWESVPDRVAGFLAPVTATYGIEVTIGLLGILLLTLGYWIFVRR